MSETYEGEYAYGYPFGEGVYKTASGQQELEGIWSGGTLTSHDDTTVETFCRTVFDDFIHFRDRINEVVKYIPLAEMIPNFETPVVQSIENGGHSKAEQKTTSTTTTTTTTTTPLKNTVTATSAAAAAAKSYVKSETQHVGQNDADGTYLFI